MTRMLVRLPRRALLGGLDVARLARACGDHRPRAELEHRFGLHPHEHRFVRALVERAPQLWVFRADQRGACGDVIVVDMSPRRAARMAYVLELKQRAAVRTSPSHRQAARHPEALAELSRLGVLEPGASARVLVGGVGVAELLADQSTMRSRSTSKSSRGSS